jgi:ABC-type uncharacterized transport system fused permease/ATPase subunit
VQGLLLLVIVMSLGYTGLSVVLNTQRGALIAALSARDEARFWQIMDVDNEALLYEQLTASDITFLSVGHRPTLDRYHAATLTLTEQQNWSIESLEVPSNPTTPKLEEVKAS